MVVGSLAAVMVWGLVFASEGSDRDCEAWPNDRDSWYSVPAELDDTTAGADRVVYKSFTGWHHPRNRGMNGWVYAALLPDGRLAYWGVIGNTKHRSFYGLNGPAEGVAARAGTRLDRAGADGLLDREARDHAEGCLDV